MSTSVDPLLPEHVELEEFRRSVNRKLWFGMGALFVIAVLALLLALVAFARPIPVVAFDKEGRALLFADTVTPRVRVEGVRVEYFARSFLERFALVDSAAVTEDFAQSLNMMTPRLRAVMLADENESSRRAKYSDLNLRGRFSSFETKIGAYDPEATNGKIPLIAWGSIRFMPRFGGTDEQGLEQHFFAQVMLERVPVTKESIHGLLVDFVHTRFFDSDEALRAHLLKEQP